MATEAVVHPVLAATTVSEQSRDVVQNIREFYERNHTPIVLASVLAVSVFINRALIRRELTRLRFTVEVVQDADLADLSQFDYLNTD